jgi:hypothetical protein
MLSKMEARKEALDTEARRPRVGDHVRVDDKIGIIVEDDDSELPFKVKFSDGTNDWCRVDKVQLVKASSNLMKSEQPEKTLKSSQSCPVLTSPKQPQQQAMKFTLWTQSTWCSSDAQSNGCPDAAQQAAAMISMSEMQSCNSCSHSQPPHSSKLHGATTQNLTSKCHSIDVEITTIGNRTEENKAVETIATKVESLLSACTLCVKEATACLNHTGELVKECERYFPGAAAEGTSLQNRGTVSRGDPPALFGILSQFLSTFRMTWEELQRNEQRWARVLEGRPAASSSSSPPRADRNSVY